MEWPAWLSEAVRDRPGSGDGLMVASIQLAIMLGALLGGLMLHRMSIAATLVGGARCWYSLR